MHFSPSLYLDPGSGSILIQMLVAAALGAGLLIRSQWAKIMQLLGRATPEEDKDSSLDNDFLDE